MINEIWKVVPGTDGILWVTNTGKAWTDTYTVIRSNGIRQTIKPKHRKITLGKNGYYHFRFKNKVQYLHRCVALAFHGEPEDEQKTVNHIDGNKTNNTPDNLEWNTYSENLNHAIRTGLKVYEPKFGEDSPASKLTEDQVKFIRENHAKGKGNRISQSVLAKEYGVTQAAISLVALNKNWEDSNE